MKGGYQILKYPGSRKIYRLVLEHMPDGRSVTQRRISILGPARTYNLHTVYISYTVCSYMRGWDWAVPTRYKYDWNVVCSTSTLILRRSYWYSCTRYSYSYRYSRQVDVHNRRTRYSTGICTWTLYLRMLVCWRLGVLLLQYQVQVLLQGSTSTCRLVGRSSRPGIVSYCKQQTVPGTYSIQVDEPFSHSATILNARITGYETVRWPVLLWCWKLEPRALSQIHAKLFVRYMYQYVVHWVWYT